MLWLLGLCTIVSLCFNNTNGTTLLKINYTKMIGYTVIKSCWLGKDIIRFLLNVRSMCYSAQPKRYITIFSLSPTCRHARYVIVLKTLSPLAPQPPSPTLPFYSFLRRNPSTTRATKSKSKANKIVSSLSVFLSISFFSCFFLLLSW